MISSVAVVTSKVISISGSCAIISFACTQAIEFLDGQFVVWQCEIDGKVYKRSYSIYNCYKASNGGQFLEFHIKKVPMGIVSNRVINDLKIGQEIMIIGPVGKMTIKESNSYLFIGIGSGLSPLHSLFDGLIQQNNNVKIGILYGERFYDDLIMDHINLLPKNDTSTLVKLSLSQDNRLGFHYGRIQQFLPEMVEFCGIENTVVYLCGKPSMVEDVYHQLIISGYTKNQIHFEKY